MLYYNQETAREVRSEAEKGLKKFVTHVMMKVFKSHALLLREEDRLEELIEDMARSYLSDPDHFPMLVHNLLYREAIVYPAQRHDEYDILLIQRSLSDWEDGDAFQLQTLLRKYSIQGGLIKGRIHT